MRLDGSLSEVGDAWKEKQRREGDGADFLSRRKGDEEEREGRRVERMKKRARRPFYENAPPFPFFCPLVNCSVN